MTATIEDAALAAIAAADTPVALDYALARFRRDNNILLARSQYLDFIRSVWRHPAEPFIVGRHTLAIADALMGAERRVAGGESVYLMIDVPYRHGKSDLVSRYFPPWLLGRDPTREIILSTYGTELTEDMSADARTVMESDEYRAIWYDRTLSASSAAKKRWRMASERGGGMLAVSIDSGVTGHGASWLLIDDPLKGRKEAESETIRKTVWESFTNNLMTRLSPVHGVIVMGTRWHIDDLQGRILARMADDPKFPRFEHLHFRAREGEPGAYRYLFTQAADGGPGRFDAGWYERQWATLGEYAAGALLQGEPMLRGGNLFKVEAIQRTERATWPAGLLWVRFWDLASTEAEREQDDPDFTAGARVAVQIDAAGIPTVYCDDVRWLRAEAPERDRFIRDTALADGPGVWQGIEAVAGYKDSAVTLKRALAGASIVYPITQSKDKLVRAAELEPSIEGGRFVVPSDPERDWVEGAIDNLAAFPSAVHDDITDAIVGAYKLALDRTRRSGVAGGGVQRWGARL